MKCPACERELREMAVDTLELQAMKAEREFKQAQAQKIYNIFRFISPSHYLKKRT
jgi:hypothetical protein